MAGGIWAKQDKVLPGFYLNIKAAPGRALSYGTRGAAAACRGLSWGPVAEIMEIGADTDVWSLLGYRMESAAELEFLRQLFLGSVNADGSARTAGASKVLLYRPAAADAAQASLTVGASPAALTVTARYPGKRGNDISISVSAQPDAEGTCTVATSVDGKAEDSQTVQNWSELKENRWVTFSGTGAASAAAAKALAGGKDGTVSTQGFASFLEAVEPHTFQVLVYDGSDETVCAAFTAFVRRMREGEGRKIQAVMASYPQADYEGVISIANGLLRKGGAELTAGDACWWVGGCTAGAGYNQSLTYAVHPEAVDVKPKHTAAQARELILNGNLVFTAEEGKARIYSDVNSLTTLTVEKTEAFCKNRPIRVLDTVANDLYRIFSDYHIGQTDNTAVGRDLIKKEVVGLVNTMQDNGGVQNFVADDVCVAAGEAADAAVVTLAVQPVDAVDKIYMTVTVS